MDTVVKTAESSIDKVMRHVQNQHHYEKLPGDLTELFFGEINAILEERIHVCHHSIHKKTMASLLTIDSGIRPLTLYLCETTRGSFFVSLSSREIVL